MEDYLWLNKRNGKPYCNIPLWKQMKGWKHSSWGLPKVEFDTEDQAMFVNKFSLYTSITCLHYTVSLHVYIPGKYGVVNHLRHRHPFLDHCGHWTHTPSPFHDIIFWNTPITNDEVSYVQDKRENNLDKLGMSCAKLRASFNLSDFY